MHTPSERDGNRTRRPLGFGGPTVPRAHAHDSFFPDYRPGNLTQWRADGRPLLAWCQRFSGCTPRAVIRECNYFTS